MDPRTAGWTALLTLWGGWVPAFVLTCVIEVPVYLVMFELFGLVGRSGSDPTGVVARRGDRSRAGRNSAGRTPHSAGRNSGGPRPALGWGGAVLLALVLNAVTHPVFWAIALSLSSSAGVVVGEVLVTLTEGLIMWLVVRRQPLACLTCALVANAASAVLGSALWAYVTSSVS